MHQLETFEGQIGLSFYRHINCDILKCTNCQVSITGWCKILVIFSEMVIKHDCEDNAFPLRDGRKPKTCFQVIIRNMAMDVLTFVRFMSL